MSWVRFPHPARCAPSTIVQPTFPGHTWAAERTKVCDARARSGERRSEPMTTSEIKVRSPQFDFTDAEVVWGPNAEAVIGLDAGSPIITPIEIFLVKVMRLAKAQLDPVADAE